MTDGSVNPNIQGAAMCFSHPPLKSITTSTSELDLAVAVMEIPA